MSEIPEKPKKSNITVEKAFDILMSFSEDRQVITAAEVAERFRLPRSTTFRYLSTLKSYGLLDERAGAGYKLGPKVYALARAAVRGTSMVEVARPYLEELSHSSGETAMFEDAGGTDQVAKGLAFAEILLAANYLS